MRIVLLLAALAVTSSGPDASNDLSERFRRHHVEIDGSTHPLDIPAAAVIDRFLLTARGEPLPVELSLEDSLVLARFAHQRCDERGTEGAAFEALRTPENLASPQAGGRAMNRLVGEMEESLRLRWEVMLAELSAPAQTALTAHLQHEVLPTVRYSRYDFEGLWTDIPELFERWRSPPDEAQAVQSHDEQQQSEAGSGVNALVMLRSGTPQWDRWCAGEFAHWVELPLARQLAVEHGLDTTDAGLEGFLRERNPKLFEFEGLADVHERELIWADALQAVVDGATPAEAYRHYGLDRHGMSEEFWAGYAARADQRRVDQTRSRAGRLTPEHMKAKELGYRWNRFAYWEDQLVDRLFPHRCDAGDGNCMGLRSPRVLECLEPAQAFYLRYAAEAIGEAPPGWQEHLLLFRPQPKARSTPASD